MGWTVYNSDGKILQSAELADGAVTFAKLATSSITGAPDLGEAPATGDSLLVSDTSASAAIKEITIANLFTAPAITGNATAATQAANNSSTRISTTAYVQTELTAYAADTVTFTNKTYDADATGNTLTNIEVANLKSGVLDTNISSVSGSDDTLASAKAIKTALDLKATVASPTFTTGATSPSFITGNSGTIKLMDGNGSNFASIAAHATTTADIAYTWPPAGPGTNGYALTSTTAGVMSWAAAGGISVNGTTDNALVTYDNGNARLNTEGNITISTISENLTLSVGAYLRMEGQNTSTSKHIQFRTTNGAEYDIEYRNSGLNFSENGVAHYRLHIKDDGDVTVLENNSSPSVVKGILKAWVRSTPTGTRTGSYNVSGVVDNGTGDWLVQWDVDFEAATYALSGICLDGGNQIVLRIADASYVDKAYVHAVVGGTKTDTHFCVMAAGEAT